MVADPDLDHETRIHGSDSESGLARWLDSAAGAQAPADFISGTANPATAARDRELTTDN